MARWDIIFYTDLFVWMVALGTLILLGFILRSFLSIDKEKIVDPKTKSEISFGTNLTIGGVIFFTITVIVTTILFIVSLVYLIKNRKAKGAYKQLGQAVENVFVQK
jgi:hypothetical protein